MERLIKTDFHLHTCYSDNRDRMTPYEYGVLARTAGYGAIGFCDHHHNLTGKGWQELRSAAEELTAPDLLVTTGYEATFVTGHLCVLNKQTFDGATALPCEREMWRPANVRIVAHPDNNSCAWRLPLPVDAVGVEIINGGQDLYAFHDSSPCNGLRTYQRYLLLNHPVAAVAQSDCHERAVFGRVWTGMWVGEQAPLTWQTMQAALEERRTFASMGGLAIRFWAEEDGAGGSLLCWEVPEGTDVTVYCVDRPVAYYGSAARSGGRHLATTPGHYWLLARRGLAWAVSSPIHAVPAGLDEGNAARRREALLADRLVQQRAATLQRQLDQLQALETFWQASLFPVARYAKWLQSLLPDHWDMEEFSAAAEELQRRAQLRLEHAQQLARAVLADVLRQRHLPEERDGHSSRVLVAGASTRGQGGPIQFMLDLPRSWSDFTLELAPGEEAKFVAMPAGGERDPIDAPRTREQLEEVVTWLRRGEMHEYALRNVAVRRKGSQLTVQFDLYPAKLLAETITYGEMADLLEELRADPEMVEFYVKTRMPHRYGVLLCVGELPASGELALTARPGSSQRSPAQRMIECFLASSFEHDPLEEGIVVQLS